MNLLSTDLPCPACSPTTTTTPQYPPRFSFLVAHCQASHSCSQCKTTFVPSWEAKLGKAVRRLWGLRDGKDWIILNSKPIAFDATVRLYEKKRQKNKLILIDKVWKGAATSDVYSYVHPPGGWGMWGGANDMRNVCLAQMAVWRHTD